MKILWWVTASVVLLAGCGGSRTGGNGGSGEAGDGTGGNDGSGGAGGGIPCGDAGLCTDGAYCMWEHGSCGSDSSDYQRCVAGPATCDGPQSPVCGCDGQVHDSYCDAVNQGVPVGRGNCQAPAGFFRCATRFCKEGEQYCRKQEVGDFVNFDCVALPNECSSCDCLPCDCMPGTPGGNECTCAEDGGDLVVECPLFAY